MRDVINVGIVEDQSLFREGMKAILNTWPDINMVFESADGYSVAQKLRDSHIIPDVMLVDYSLPALEGKEFSGLHVTQTLTQLHPDMKILILSVHDNEHFINQVIEQGAHGYLVKDSDPQEVHEAIVHVYSKGVYINERTLKALQHKQSARPKERNTETLQQDAKLTRREEEILQLICQQYTAEEIAEKLFLSVRTVNGHRNNLLQKTGVRNTAGLVLYAVKHGIAPL
jgi:two-component system, NarL family, response regulator NreC